MNKEKLSPGNLAHVRLQDSFWGKYTHLVTTQILPYQWRILNDLEPGAVPSHCIENFRIAAGEVPGTFSGEVFQDTDVAKWLESVAYSLSYETNPALEKQADDVIALLEKAQQPDGYLDTYFILHAPDSKFRNLQQGHELYTAGHMMEAAAAYFQVTGKDRFLKIMCRTADLICTVFRQPEYSEAIPGHEEIEIGLLRLYEVTKKKDYLEMAKDFVDRRGQTPDYFAHEREHPHWIEIYREMSTEDHEYAQYHQPVREQKEAVGHAVRAVYLYCAMADLAYAYQDQTLFEACENLYQSMVTKRMYITGGIGSSGHLERFTADYDLPNASDYAESCASVGLALFCRRMAQITGDAQYIETMETALMNTVLAGIAMDGKSFFYVNPLEVWPDNCLPYTSMAHVKPVRQAWFSCACCPPNIARTLASLGSYVYFLGENSLWINLYASGTIEETVNGASIRISISSKLPFHGEVSLKVMAEADLPITLALRCPKYAEHAVLMINGTPQSVPVQNGYWHIDRIWNNDEISIAFDMPAHFVYANPRVRADSGKAAIVKGPLVYCLEQTDNGDNLASIFVDTAQPLTEVYQDELLGGTMTILAKGKRLNASSWEDNALYASTPAKLDDITLTLIPYCYWGNRTSGEMLVWMKTLI